MICDRRKQTKEAFQDDHSDNHDYYQDDVDFYENHEEYNDEYDVDDPPGEWRGRWVPRGARRSWSSRLTCDHHSDDDNGNGNEE